MNYDIVCICETFLRSNDEIDIPGYTWIGHHRRKILPSARRGSGGVGLLVKSSLYAAYDFNILDNEVDDILWVKVTSRSDGSHILICVCYLAPFGSSRYIDAAEYFDKLLAQVCEYQNIGRMIIGGDFNSRCANLSDYIEGVDDIKERESIDDHENSYCNAFMEFLISSSFCMLNGRVGTNGYTSVSEKGKAVVDYICVPHYQLTDHQDFNVIPVSDIANKFNLPLPDKLTQMPDHSLLVTTITTSNFIPTMDEPCLPSVTKYNVKDIPDVFMKSDKHYIQEAIARIESELVNQDNVDKAYDTFLSMINGEMKKHLKTRKSNINTTKKVKNTKLQKKPWWNQDLDELWKEVCMKEKRWLKHKGGSKQDYKRDFVTSRRSFSHKHRKAKRAYQSRMQDELSEMCQEQQQEFWKKVKSVGIQAGQKRTLPLAVRGEDGGVVADPEQVREQWASHFHKLHNSKLSKNYDELHYNEIMEYLDNNEYVTSTDNSDFFLNRDLSYYEVKRAVLGAKNNKACGTDNIFSEVLKNDVVIQCMHKLFNHCFQNSTVPSMWKDGIISPIYKAGDSLCTDNYRGVTLLNTSCKIYSDILNRRLYKWLEENNKICDEQNGFRAE